MQRLVVGLDDDEQIDVVADVLTEAGAARVDKDAIHGLGALRVDFPATDDVAALVARVQALPGVAYAEPVGLRGVFDEGAAG